MARKRRNRIRRILSDRRRLRYWHTLRQELMAQRDAGTITKRDFDIAFDTMSDPRKADRVISQASDELGEVDWVGIVDWIKENWVGILKVIISVAFLFLEPKPEDGTDQPD